VAGGCAVSGLRGAVADYLTVRRTLGFKLAGAGLLLEQFVDFADAADTDTITTQLAVQWATSELLTRTRPPKEAGGTC
jgi:integrase/recombinase XerD